MYLFSSLDEVEQSPPTRISDRQCETPGNSGDDDDNDEGGLNVVLIAIIAACVVGGIVIFIIVMSCIQRGCCHGCCRRKDAIPDDVLRALPHAWACRPRIPSCTRGLFYSSLSCPLRPVP